MKAEEKKSLQRGNADHLTMLEETAFSDCKKIVEHYGISEEATREIISQTIESSQLFTHALWRFTNVIKNYYPNVFNVIAPKSLLTILQHLRKVVFQKVENRNVGVSIILFANNNQIKQYGDYHLQTVLEQEVYYSIKDYFNEKEKSLVRSYKGIKSKNAFFAFSLNNEDNTIRFRGIKAFDNKSFETICVDDAIGFNLSENIPCIRIYHQGARIVDYMLSEATGNWIIRPENELHDIIANQLEGVMDQDIYILTKAVMQLSYLRIGTILVITPEINRFSKVESYFSLESNSLENDLREELLFQYAANDGAVVISHSPGCHLIAKKIGVILNPIGTEYDTSEYKNLVNDSNCGSRHEKAARYACEHPDDCLIVISENRSISILHGETPIYWRDEIYV